MATSLVYKQSFSPKHNGMGPLFRPPWPKDDNTFAPLIERISAGRRGIYQVRVAQGDVFADLHLCHGLI